MRTINGIKNNPRFKQKKAYLGGSRAYYSRDIGYIYQLAGLEADGVAAGTSERRKKIRKRASILLLF